MLDPRLDADALLIGAGASIGVLKFYFTKAP